MKLVIVAVLALFAGVAPQSQQSNKFEVAGIDDPLVVTKFLRSLQEAVAKNDRTKVAAMVSYPVAVLMTGRRVKLRNKAEFLSRYNLVMNRKVKRAIAAQKPDDLFANWQGVMIGDGEIWFNQLYRHKVIKITAINNQ